MSTNVPLAALGRRRGVAATAVVPALVAGVAGFLLALFARTALREPAWLTSAWWPSTAVAILILTRVWSRYWVPVAVVLGVGVMLGDAATSMSWSLAAVFGLANAVEALVAVTLYQRVQRSAPPVRSAGEAVRLLFSCLGGVLAGTAVMAARAAVMGTRHEWTQAWQLLPSHAAGLIVLAPLLLLAPSNAEEWRAIFRNRSANLECLAVLVGSAALSGWLFFSEADDRLVVVLVVPLVYAAMRLDPLRAMVVDVVVCTMVTIGTVQGFGIVASLGTTDARLWALRGVITVCCLVTLFVSLVTHSRATVRARLRDSERLVALAFDGAPSGMYIASLAPGHVGELLYVNTALCELVMRPREDLVGRHVEVLAPADDARLARTRIADMLARRFSSESRERMLLRADGRQVPTREAINVVFPEQGPPYLIAQITDLRPQQEAHAALLDAFDTQRKVLARLREATESRKSAVRALSHDLRSPLTSVRAYQELLLDGAAGDLTAEQREMLEIAFRNTDRVIDLVDDLATAAALEAEPVDVTSHQRVPIDEVLAAVLDTTQSLCTRRRQTLVRPAAPLGVRVEGDAVQLERALLNVLSNAVKYTPEGGTVTVATMVIDDRLAIAVTDTGIGIPAHQIEHLGEQFFRAESALAEGIPGTGLGLAVTKAVLTQHGGSMSVSSSDRGSTFTLTLPVVDACVGV